MNTIVQNYGKKSLPNAYRFRTAQELNEFLDNKSLTEKDLDYLYYLRGEYHGFRSERDRINAVMSTHINEPSAIIFLDIKGTLYEGGTHESGKELLARSPLDSKPITYDEIDALGNIIVRTMPQDFHQGYKLNNGYKIVPTEYAYEEFLVKRKLDKFDSAGHFHRPEYMTKHGAFTVVFISSDTVETQKNIVAFLYYMARYIDKTRGYGMRERFGIISSTDESSFGKTMKRIEEILNKNCNDISDIQEVRRLLHYIDNQRDISIEGNIKRIEESLLKYNNDFMKFLEYENHDYANLDSLEIKEFKEIINGLYFLSTSETGKTKGQLMEEFLESSTRKKRVGSNYSLFALGDSYLYDGEMLRKAYQYGGVGYIRGGDNCYSYTGSIDLTKDLAKEGINIPYIPIVNSITEFYNHIMKALTMVRESEIINAMIYANRDVACNRILENLNVPCQLTKTGK